MSARQPYGLSIDTDAKIAALAAAQHGVVARSQLLQAGLTARAISGGWSRTSARHPPRRLRRRPPGADPRGPLDGSNPRVRPDAALSHTTAAAAADLRRAGTAIHVTVPGRGGRQAPRGITLHRSPTLTPRRSRRPRHPGHDRRARRSSTSRESSRTQTSNGSCTRPTSAASWTSATSKQPDPPPYKRCYAPTTPPRREATSSAHSSDSAEITESRRPEVNVSSTATSSTSSGATATSSSRSTATTTTAHRRSSSQTASRTSPGTRGWTTRRFTWRQVTTRAQWVAAAIG